MVCLNCGGESGPGAQVCARCGRPLPVYGAPQGFVYDPAAGQYVRPEQGGGRVWFDPVSGRYTQEAPPPVSPPGEAAAGQPRQGPEAPAPGPEGFAFDGASGLYYRVDHAQGDSAHLTWYAPDTQEYAQVRHVAVPPPGPGLTPGYGPGPTPTRPAGGGGKKPLVIALSVVLIAALGFGGWKLLGSSDEDAPAASSEPEGAESAAASVEAAPPAAPDAIDWQEPAIEAAVRGLLNKPEGGLTRDDLGGIQTLFLFGDTVGLNQEPPESAIRQGNIRTLADVSHFPALQQVIVFENPVRDLSPLTSLTTVHHITARGCALEDISPLSQMTWLTDLHLSDNQIADISPLAACRELTYLTLDGNRIRDASPLAGLPALEILDLRENPVENWEAVSHVEDLRGRPETPAYAGDERFQDLDALFGLERDVLLEMGELAPDVYIMDGYLEFFRAEEIDSYFGFPPDFDTEAPKTLRAVHTTTKTMFGVDSMTIGELRERFGSDLIVDEWFNELEDDIVQDVYVDLGQYRISFTDAETIEDDAAVSTIYIGYVSQWY